MEAHHEALCIASSSDRFFIHPQAKNVHMVAVGVGQYVDFQGQLEEIAGKNVYNADNFDELSNLFSDVLKEACSK